MNGAQNNVKRVLFIEPQPFFTNRGSPFRAKATVNALVELGYEVDLLVYPFGEDISLPGVTVHRSLRPLWIKDVRIGPSWAKVCLDVLLAVKAFMLVRRQRYVMIHGVEEAVLIAWLLGTWKRIPYIMDMHSCMPEQLAAHPWLGLRPFMKLAYRFEGFCARRAAGIQTVSDVITERSQRLAPHVPAVTVEDIALDDCTPDVQQVELLRREFKLEGRKVVVYTGNLAQYQGVELLIEAFGRLHAMAGESDVVRKSILLLVGGGPEAGSRIAGLEALAAKWNVQGQVIFAGERPVGEMGSFMALADVLVSPRAFGAHTPLKIYSYMTAGKPIVATRIKSHTNVLDDSCAFLCEPDAQAFAVGLATVLGGAQAEGRRRAEAAREKVTRCHSRARFVERMGELYRRAMVASAKSGD